MKKKVAVLGATGSVGKNALDVLREGKDFFEPVLFTCHTNREDLLKLGREFPSAMLALSAEPDGAARTAEISHYGRSGLLRAILSCGADIAVNGIAGGAGLEPSMTVLESGANLALANKETIVMAGSLVFEKAHSKNVTVLPVDSEHSAIFNLCEAHGRENIDEVLLTASGGPFRDHTGEQLKNVTREEALTHPVWKMGQKITVDCATLANKGLEVIESAILFDLDPSQITVVIHPQSIIHSMVRLKDGVVYAQLSRPDMRLPIHDTLYWPELQSCPFGRLSFDNLSLSFEKPDYKKFPLLALACQAAKQDGLYPAVYNAANEAAVEAFLSNRVVFLEISRIVEYVLQKDWSGAAKDIQTVLEADSRAKDAANSYVAALR
ncbi:MAG: 1-deoxy-D-xylulose-5-phosphate reductoisomerase [Treponema sp.]|jgi:1-deoxy-D-xylulose-5-phosphate reductoisomerase|nr:1-deoxy-D-xylulose-5-phosphate reductoisomerase [Treponema sp.]